MNMIETNHELILRDENMEDAGEITRFNAWHSTIKLNDLSSWQLDMHTVDFENYEINETSGIMFKRDGELILTGPVTSILQTLTGGEEKTSVFGACDLYWLQTRICYPVVTGPQFENGNWYFKVKRCGEGLSSTVSKDTTAGGFVLNLVDAFSFVVGATITVMAAGGVSGNMTYFGDETVTLLDVDWATNDIVFDMELIAPVPAKTSVVQHTDDIVDDPAYQGYDVRKGRAEGVAKGLVYDNAGKGACSDHFGTRAIPHLTVAPSAGRGAEVTSNARGENLLSQVKDVCLSGGLNFHVLQKGQDLVFDCYMSHNLTTNDDLIFSYEYGSLKDYSATHGAPTSNFVMGYGPGTGAYKLMLPSADIPSITQFGRREDWTSAGTAQAGDTAAQIAANMVQSNNTHLATSLVNTQLTISLQETASVTYPTDFNIGDIVSVMIGTKKFSIPITAVDYTIPASTGEASGSAITSALSRTESKAMREQKQTTKILRQMNMV